MSKDGAELIFQQMEREIAEVHQPVPSGLLYHYTDAFGLDGIVRNAVFHATHYRFMNDSTELDEGRRVVLDVCAALEADNSLRKEARDLVHDFRISFDNPAVEEATRDIFIASLSGKRDDLGQWRAYGKAGAGYAVGLKFVKDTTAVPGDRLVGFLAPCEYDRALAAESFKKDLLEILAKIERYVVTYHTETGLEDMWTRSMTLALRRLGPHWLRIKNKHFKDEAEWRLIALPSREKMNEQVKTKQSTVRGTIPYVEISLAPETPPKPFIDEIIVGPTQDPERGVLGVRLLLETAGYKPEDAKRIVVASEIPFRG